MKVRVESKVVRLGPNETVEFEIPDGEAWVQTVTRNNAQSVEVLVAMVEREPADAV